MVRSLAYLLGSTEHAATYLNDTFGRRPHVFRVEDRGEEEDVSRRMWPPITLAEMEELWVNASRSDDGNAVLCFRDGKQVGIKNTPFFAYAHDCSVVVNRADRFSRAVYSLCKSLEDAFPFVFCNVYLTPAGSQTVPPHSDDREVLAVQVLGEKQWTIWGNPPVPQPYKEDEVGKTSAVDVSQLPVAFEETVRTGDVLYIPRGWVHAARAPQSASSLHLTIAIQTSDWDIGSVLRDGVASWMRSLDAASMARQVLSPATLAGNDPTSTEAGCLQALARRMVEALRTEDCIRAWRERVKALAAARDNAVSTSLQPIDHPLQLGSAVLWHTTVHIAKFEESRSTKVSSLTFVVHLQRDDGSVMPLSLSGSTRHALVTLSRCTRSPMRVADIPLGCPLARLSLANWLLRNGCLVRVL